MEGMSFKRDSKGNIHVDNVEATKALNPNSVEITLGAKNEVRFTVKSYSETTDEAMEKATKIFDELTKIYIKE